MRELSDIDGKSSQSILRQLIERSKSNRLSAEALVSVIRAFIAADDLESANAVFMLLLERFSGAITNKLRLWSSIPPQQMEDVRQSIVLGLYEFICSLDAGEELWECNFKTCFDCRFLNIIGKLTRGSLVTVSASQSVDNEQADEAFESADLDAELQFESVHIKEALHYLDQIDSRYGRSFYLKYFAELSEKEIAELMEVSERTVRNWIGASKTKLQEFFAEQ